MFKKLSCGLLALTMAFNTAPALIGNSISSTNFGAVGVFAEDLDSSSPVALAKDGSHTITTDEVSINITSYFSNAADVGVYGNPATWSYSVDGTDTPIANAAAFAPGAVGEYTVTATWVVSEATTDGDGNSVAAVEETATITITVDAMLTEVTLEPDVATITVGGNVTLNTSYEDQFGDPYSLKTGADAETVSYSSSNTDVATVSEAGTVTGVVDSTTAVTITATVKAGGQDVGTGTATNTVIADEKLTSVAVSVTGDGEALLTGTDFGALTFSGNGSPITGTLTGDGSGGYTLTCATDLNKGVTYTVSYTAFDVVRPSGDDYFKVSSSNGATLTNDTDDGALGITVTTSAATKASGSVTVDGIGEGSTCSMTLYHNILPSVTATGVWCDTNENYTFSFDDVLFFANGTAYTPKITVDGVTTTLSGIDITSGFSEELTYTAPVVPEEEYVAPEVDDETEDDADDTYTDADIDIDDIEVEDTIEDIEEATDTNLSLFSALSSLFNKIESILTLNITGSGKITVPVTNLKVGEKVEVFYSINGGSNWSVLPSSYLSTKGAMATMVNGVISNSVTSNGTSLNLVIDVPSSSTGTTMIQIASVEAASSGSTPTGGSYTSATYHDSGSVRVNGSYITELRNVLVGELVNLSKITTVNGQEVTGWYYDSAMTKEITNPSQFVITSSVISDGIYARTSGTTVVPDSYVDGSTNAGTGTTTAPDTTYQPSVVPSTVANLLGKLF